MRDRPALTHGGPACLQRARRRLLRSSLTGLLGRLLRGLLLRHHALLLLSGRGGLFRFLGLLRLRFLSFLRFLRHDRLPIGAAQLILVRQRHANIATAAVWAAASATPLPVSASGA